MIIVEIAPALFEYGLQTGSGIARTQVVAGLQAGALLVGCCMNVQRNIELHFTDPLSGPDRQLTIVLKTFPHRTES